MNTIKMNLQQKQSLSQKQIHSLEVLAMDNMQVQEMLQTEYMENPLLDYTGENQNTEFQEDYFQGLKKKDRKDVDREDGYIENFVAGDRENHLEEYILYQLDMKKYTKQEWKLMKYMINCLDESGFLMIDEEEIASKNGISQKAVKVCLTDLKRLEPAGIFSSGLKECLLIQLKQEGEENSLTYKIVEGYLTEVAEGKISKISRTTGYSTAAIRKAIHEIQHLNPRPLYGGAAENTEYIIPDIIVQRKENVWEIRLNDDWMKDYRINDYYMQMMEQVKDEELKQYFKSKLEHIHFIMDGIEQRRNTIINICGLITKYQQDFLEKKDCLLPLTMQNVAEELGIHTSTVSRAVKGKYLQYPNGTILLKDLFVNPSGKNMEKDISADKIKEYIRKLIEKEDKRHPYSDNYITEKIKQAGYSISRRTIAKYREKMRIPGSFLRKTE